MDIEQKNPAPQEVSVDRHADRTVVRIGNVVLAVREESTGVVRLGQNLTPTDKREVTSILSKIPLNRAGNRHQRRRAASLAKKGKQRGSQPRRQPAPTAAGGEPGQEG